ncbi:BLUF domain-containing protein [Mucilaginibacter robiniae]|uniref:BLUF domain-containing protein n=1 Tax=Mucilaginibacter robiniae TaxID=2728022 RepID=A0A7L5E2W9_9SPHI|nr:BLUF domain-containing protein [Mucilaginibacter robiniae]QJD94686.1 BLUF domain-containing protein [Mucilaginibacter robiniae]
MKQLVYISSACKLMNEDELLDILTVSRRNNNSRNLTGMLLYGEGTFIQVLEGEPEILEQTYDVIKQDLRHKNIIKMMESTITERNFPEWAMGFKSVNAEELSEFRGYVDPTRSDFLHEDNVTAIIGMLKTFVSTNRMI